MMSFPSDGGSKLACEDISREVLASNKAGGKTVSARYSDDSLVSIIFSKERGGKDDDDDGQEKFRKGTTCLVL